MIYGNTDGIKRHILDMLENLYSIKNYDFIDNAILEAIVKVSADYNREIGVAINRNGKVLAISIGSSGLVSAINVGKGERSLSGVRFIHTHPNASSMLSEADLSVLRNNVLDAIAAVGISSNGDINGFTVAYIDGSGAELYHTQDINTSDALKKIIEAEKRYRASVSQTKANKDEIERAILVSVDLGAEQHELNLVELKELAKTAGAQVVGALTQSRSKPDNRYILGKGKLEELKLLIQNSGANLVIMDEELSGLQQRNLEEELGIKVIDRSGLILDIFASRATSLEGMLQVELAQLKYNLPRLIGMGGDMGRFRNGIGMRGPGEKKLELDRRRIKEQINDLERRIEKLGKERDLRRKNRFSQPSVALVGYTNAGKSTLMNLLSRSDVLAEDKLFATLDPVTRKVYAAEKKFYLLTDTVGFIRKLPHQFIEAFKSTLEEAVYADVLVHVMDASNPNLFNQYKVVCEVLESIGAGNKPMINVYNKMDKVNSNELTVPVISGVYISAKTGQGIEELKKEIISKLNLL